MSETVNRCTHDSTTARRNDAQFRIERVCDACGEVGEWIVLEIVPQVEEAMDLHYRRQLANQVVIDPGPKVMAAWRLIDAYRHAASRSQA